uniref:hypothetical protein n=1 Tax=Prevotella sp. TaxID=59823 RepID=UPI004024C2C4
LNNKVYICSIFYKISIFFIEIIITRLVHPAPTSFWYMYNRTLASSEVIEVKEVITYLLSH